MPGALAHLELAVTLLADFETRDRRVRGQAEELHQRQGQQARHAAQRHQHQPEQAPHRPELEEAATALIFRAAPAQQHEQARQQDHDGAQQDQAKGRNR